MGDGARSVSLTMKEGHHAPEEHFSIDSCLGCDRDFNRKRTESACKGAAAIYL
jgi:hypothetical protein